MGQEISKEENIPARAQKLLEKRDRAISEYENDLNKIQSDGIINKKEARRISRRSRDIQNFDTRLQRSGFIPPQTSVPTSKTTQIALPQFGLEQSSGFNISPRRGGGGGGTGTIQYHPFQIVRSSGSNVEIRPGNINSILPTGIIGGSGNLVQYPTTSAIQYISLRATTDGEKVISANIFIGEPSVQQPEIFGLPSSADFVIGIVTSSDIYQITKDNISIVGQQQFVASKTSIGAGELPYEIYYIWGQIK